MQHNVWRVIHVSLAEFEEEKSYADQKLFIVIFKEVSATSMYDKKYPLLNISKQVSID